MHHASPRAAAADQSTKPANGLKPSEVISTSADRPKTITKATTVPTPKSIKHTGDASNAAGSTDANTPTSKTKPF
jgi:hypothetical protein